MNGRDQTSTKRLLVLAAALIVTHLANAQDNQAKSSCDKLPYRLGRLVVLNSTDLRSSTRRITKKEWKEMSKKQGRVQAECNTFVSKHPGQPVSTEFSYTVDGFAAYYGRCESFCGTEQDLLELTNKEVEGVMAPHK